jgi:hypothetical protein
MSNSWGGGGYDSALRDAIIAARDADIIFVAAAGNNSSNNDTTPTYPASFDVANIVAVAATDRNDALAYFSNYGANTVELGAPGVDIFSTYNTSDSAYGTLSGTSMATPHVSGALALLRAQFPELNYSDTIAELLATVDPIPSLAGKTISGGRLNLQKLLTHRDPLRYQWRKEGADIPGATNSIFTIQSVSFADAANYSVLVSNGCGPTISSNASLTVTSCGVLAVTPGSGFNSSGAIGGPFTPSAQIYTLQNVGDIDLSWSVMNTTIWTTLSATSGTLPAGTSTNVTVLINSNANSLAVGIYSDSITFTNLSNGKGTTTRAVSLSVNLPGVLSVISGTNICNALPAAAPNGQSFGNVLAGQTYSYLASGCVVHNFQGTGNSDPDGNQYSDNCTTFLQKEVAPTSYLCPGIIRFSLVGKINGGSCIQMGTAGSFVAAASGLLTLYFNDDNFGDNSGSWNVCISSGSSDFNAVGPQGGPFSPSNHVYTLSNTGSSTLNWSVNASDNWLTLNPTNGTLDPGASTAMVASVNGNANAFPAANYSITLVFTNRSSNLGSTNLLASLSVTNGGVFFDDVESGTNGWSASGFWHIVGSGSCSNCFSPTHSWYYGLDATCTYDNGGTNSGNLISPSFTVPVSGVLTFQSWEQTEGITMNFDKRQVSISTNGGASWNQILQSVNNSAAWYPVTNDLSAYTGKLAQLRFRFDTVDERVNNYRGWYLDDVRVESAPTLTVAPATSLEASGEQGGPFTPAFLAYTLSNIGNTPLIWSANVSDNWLDLSLTNGTLSGGTTTNVIVSINAVADGLVGGLYSATVDFVNATNGKGNANRLATLLVRDGISDDWRFTYWHHVDPRAEDQSRAQDDSDGDGIDNLHEFLAGTDPTNPDSMFRILSIAKESDDVRVIWRAGSGRTNVVQASDSGGVYSTNFTDISGTLIINGIGDQVTNYLDFGAVTNAPSRYYRIRIAP